MKNILTATLSMIILASFLIMCSQNESGDELSLFTKSELAQELNPEVGKPINVDLAVSWIKAFEEKNQGSRASYLINIEGIKQLLNAKFEGAAIDGIRFLKGINDQQEEELVLIPVQDGHDLWYLSAPGSAERASDEGTAFSAEGILNIHSAKLWVRNFVSTHSSDEVHRSYFVGKNSLKQLTDLTFNRQSIEGIRIYKAIKDDGKETFILAPVINQATLGSLENRLHGTGLRNTSGDDVVYLEYSSPCPSSCDSTLE